MAWTEQGLNDLSQTYHRLYRKNLSRGMWKEKERPILLNNWEATMMDFTEESILKIAQKGKEAGVELFVLDDGWFGARNDDYRGLGDWRANLKKLPEGIGGLARKVNAMGLKFGLWFEPEMVNEDSDMYRQHPDWILNVPGRDRSLGRHQMVLDFSKEEVVNNLYEQMHAVLSDAAVDYVKWDMNRTISECFSIGKAPEEQGMLYYAPQAWCSDDTDMKAKKVLALTLSTIMAFSLAGCGAGKEAATTDNTAEEAAATQTTEEAAPEALKVS